MRTQACVGLVSGLGLLRVQALAPLAEALVSSGTHVVFVGSSTPDQMADFLDTTGKDLCFQGGLFTDPGVALYKHFSLKRGILRSLVRPFFTAFKSYGVKGVIEGIRLGKETSHLAGDSWQQGGTILLDPQGEIIYQHTEEHPADWPDMEAVFKLVGVEGSKVDYQAALNQWLKLREENRARQAS